MSYKVTLYTTEDNGTMKKLSDTIQDREYSSDGVMDLLALVMSNKFNDDITGIIINKLDTGVDIDKQ
jgi:hypothetical protein